MFRPIASDPTSELEIPKENAIEVMFKSIHDSFLYYYYRFFGSAEMRSSIRLFEQTHDQVIEHEFDANMAIYKIHKASFTDHPLADSNIFLIKTAYDQLTQNKNTLEEIQNNLNIHKHLLLVNRVTSDIKLIDKQLLVLERTGRTVGVELNIKLKLNLRNEEKYKQILMDLSSNEIHKTKINIAEELIKKGISLVSIIHEEIPHGSNSYSRDVKDDKTKLGNIERKLIYLYKTLATSESTSKRISDRLLALRGHGIDPSVILYKLIEEVENDNKPDHLISHATRENTIIRVLVNKIDMTIDRLVVHNQNLTLAKFKLSKRS